MWLTTAFVIFATVVVVRYLVKYAKRRQFYHSLPGETSFSYFFGNLHKFPGPNEEGKAYDHNMSRLHKYFRRVWAGPFYPVVLTYHPLSVRPVLKSTAPKPRQWLLSSVYDMAVPWLGEGLLIANGHKWARNRRLLTPAFHFEILKNYMAVYNDCVSLLLANMEKQGGKSFDLFHVVELSALDVILRCAFSYKSDCQVAQGNSYTSAMLEILVLWTKRSLKPHLFIDFLYSLTSDGRRFYRLCKLLHKMSEEIIAKRKKDLANIHESELKDLTQEKTKDFLDILLLARDEDGVGLSDLDIRNEVDTFLFEGHDTTASGMSWTLYSLAQHPQYQDRVYQEVKTVLGDREHVELSDLAKLEYTAMCIKESLRHHAAVPFIARYLEEPMDIAGHTMPKGTMVAVHIWILHHNPHVWEDPMTYDPERFHPDKTQHMDPFQFVPFSAGSRNCIGQNFAMNEMKVIVARTIQKYHLTLDPAYETRQYLTPTMKAENGVMVYASPRQD